MYLILSFVFLHPDFIGRKASKSRLKKFAYRLLSAKKGRISTSAQNGM